MRDSRSEIEEIKSRLGIVEVISEYVALRKAGRNFVGLCPFHKEKTPSFSVNAERQIFYCFGCGSGGDVFEFIMKVNNMSFPETLSLLAERAGIVLQQKKPPQSSSAEKTLREEIKRINQLAGEHFIRNLNSESGRGAREYLHRRQIKDETVREFRLGLAMSGWRQLRDSFEKAKTPLPIVEKAGLVIRGEKGDFYDRFRGRLIFPIENIAGEIIAFGGRASGEEKPKYLNSPESPVYTKGRNLYGLNRAKDEIRKRGYAVLVEGYFDVLSLWNAGIRNAVAALGTALTREHLDLLRRFTTQVVAVFDPDEGGRSALERSLALFLEEKFNARAVILPENLDPDDFVKKYGSEAMERVIKDSQSLVDYYIENIIGAKGGFEHDLDAVRKAVSFISRIEDPVQRNLFIKRVSEKLSIEQELLKSEIVKTASGRRKQETKPVGMSESRQDRKGPNPVEMTLIRVMAEYPDKVASGLNESIFDFLQNPDLKRLGLELKDKILREEPFHLSDLPSRIEDEALRKQLLEWGVTEAPFGEEVAGKLFEDTVAKIRASWFRAKNKELSRELLKAQEKGNTGLCSRIMDEKKQLLKKERQLSNSENRALTVSGETADRNE